MSRRVRQRAYLLFERSLGAPPRFNASARQPRPGPNQTRLGLWWTSHPGLIQAVAVAAIAWTVAYLVWRWGWSHRDASLVVWGPLLLVEMFGLWSLSTLAFFGWSRPPAVRPPTTPGRTVDVYVCTYNENVDVLRTTLAGCNALTYPHTTYLLDDGRRPEMAELAAEMGAVWITRPDNSHAKAGNINHALSRTTGELVFILDADHVPMPDALDALVGYFDDPDLALVQTPHDFYNHDSAQHYDIGRHEQSIFFDVICPGKDRHGAAFWCGSATLVRRDALLQVGGVATETIAEDFHTTIKLHRRGWKTRYHNEILVQGLAPHDMAAYLLQRDRWARGNIAVFTTPESPFRARELNAKQRLSYFASIAAYCAGPMRVLLLLVLSATLWTGALPMRASLPALAWLWFPSVVLSMVAASALSRGFMRIADSTHFELATAEIHLRALRCAVRPGRANFRVTPKEGVDLGGWENLRQLELVLAVAAVLGTGVVARVVDTLWLDLLPDLPGVALWVVPVLGLIELRRVARTLVIVARRRQRRYEFRFPCDEPATLTRATAADTVGDPEPARPARVMDLSTTGMGLVCPDRYEAGERLVVEVPLPNARGHVDTVVAEVEARLCLPHGDGYRLGTAIRYVSPPDKRRLVEFCYIVCPYERLRGERPAHTGLAAVHGAAEVEALQPVAGDERERAAAS